uniref:J domain-containing protein n=1 Tax=Amorphochlora amoebiformis TaxID=1561963 RepID=A0A7S0DQD5_9EUKA|mmetsp:Transcript_34278/g.55220  ORF Transcript_34278/g.55220 Transcript_34278/m.55220 type:complete len:604 (+) Transcript_34278:31-1842(+)
MAPDTGTSVFLLVLLLVGSKGNTAINPYEKLGLRRGASERQIKDSYKKLAKSLHPDKNKNADAGAKFIEIQEAHQLLSSAASRREWAEERAKHKGEDLRKSEATVVYTSNGVYRRKGPDLEILPNTIRLTAETYDSLVKAKPGRVEEREGGDETHFWLIYFHRLYCDPCARFKSTWKEVARLGWPAFRPADVLVDTDFSLSQNLGVRRVPSLVAVRVANGKRYTKIYNVKSKPSVNEIMNFATKWMTYSNPIRTLGPPLSKPKMRTALKVKKSAEKVRIVIISNRAQPHFSLGYCAMKFKDLQFFHIDGRSEATRRVAVESLDLSSESRKACAGKKACLIVLREDGWPMVTIGKEDGLSAHASELSALVESHKSWFVPELKASNYYDLCYRFAGTPISSEPKKLILNRPRTDDLFGDERFCVVALTSSHSKAQAALQPLVEISGDPTPHLGWISISAQREFYEYFERKFEEAGGVPQIRALVAVRPAIGEYSLFLGQSSEELVKWVKNLQNKSVSFSADELQEDDDDEEDPRNMALPFPTEDGEASILEKLLGLNAQRLLERWLGDTEVAGSSVGFTALTMFIALLFLFPTIMMFQMGVDPAS